MDNPEFSEKANRLILEFMCFEGDCREIAEKVLKNDYFQRCCDLLTLDNNNYEVLFSLSNMVADKPRYAELFFKE